VFFILTLKEIKSWRITTTLDHHQVNLEMAGIGRLQLAKNQVVIEDMQSLKAKKNKMEFGPILGAF
jgi:hypothetical protein